MNYKYRYKTKNNMDDIILVSDGEYLTGLYFENSNDAKKHVCDCVNKNLDIFKCTIKWLDIYFSGSNPDFTPKYKINNLTPFRSEVIDILNTIPYGSTLTYGFIADIIAKKRGISKMSSQAVGSAIGSNPICIIVPCHRVLGSNNKLGGYGGGLNNKIALLESENIKYNV